MTNAKKVIKCGWQVTHVLYPSALQLFLQDGSSQATQKFVCQTNEGEIYLFFHLNVAEK